MSSTYLNPRQDRGTSNFRGSIRAFDWINAHVDHETGRSYGLHELDAGVLHSSAILNGSNTWISHSLCLPISWWHGPLLSRRGSRRAPEQRGHGIGVGQLEAVLRGILGQVEAYHIDVAGWSAPNGSTVSYSGENFHLVGDPEEFAHGAGWYGEYKIVFSINQ